MAASDKQAFLATWIDVELPQRFPSRVLAVDSTVAQMWGVKRGESAARGVVLPPADAQIAATAIVHGMVVVTRNEVDLQRCGATTVNPWS
jgi:predicted nucleic acid-binding protein